MYVVRGFVSLLGRVLLAAIFLASAGMNHIPHFNQIVQMMTNEKVPMPAVSHMIAIALMLIGGVLLVLGWYARIGAFLLAVFLALAAFYIHHFWTFQDQAMMHDQMAHFMKNVALIGAMLFIIANGGGAWSLDGCCPTTAMPPK